MGRAPIVTKKVKVKGSARYVCYVVHEGKRWWGQASDSKRDAQISAASLRKQLTGDGPGLSTQLLANNRANLIQQGKFYCKKVMVNMELAGLAKKWEVERAFDMPCEGCRFSAGEGLCWEFEPTLLDQEMFKTYAAPELTTENDWHYEVTSDVGLVMMDAVSDYNTIVESVQIGPNKYLVGMKSYDYELPALSSAVRASIQAQLRERRDGAQHPLPFLIRKTGRKRRPKIVVAMTVQDVIRQEHLFPGDIIEMVLGTTFTRLKVFEEAGSLHGLPVVQKEATTSKHWMAKVGEVVRVLADSTLTAEPVLA